jgi:capsular polysaccharide biosynthesis protein
MWLYRWSTLGIIVLMTVLGGLSGLLGSEPVTATAQMTLKNPGENDVLAPGVVGDASTSRYVEQRAQFVTTDEVLQAVSVDSDLGIGDLRDRIAAEPVSGTNTIYVTATASGPDEAADLANLVVEAYRTVTTTAVDDLTRRAVDELALNQEALRRVGGEGPEALAAADTLADLQRQTTELRLGAILHRDGVDFVNQARPEDAVVPGPPVREVGVGLGLGLLVAGFAAWIRADRNRRVTDANTPVKALDAPLLAVVARPERGALLARTAEGAAPAAIVPRSEFQLVGAALLRRAPAGVIIVLAPPRSRQDRSDAVVDIAAAVAADGSRVLVVDADPDGRVTRRLEPNVIVPTLFVNGSSGAPRRPSPHPVQATTVVAGASDLLSRESALIAPTRVRLSDDVEFSLLKPSPDDARASGLVAREFADRVASARTDYDMVLIDAPHVDATPVVPALLRVATGILAVVPRGSDETALIQIRRTADISTTPLLGFVYTGAARGMG